MSSSSQYDKAALFQQLGNGSETALMQLHALYAPALLSYCLGIITSHDLAKDIVMDTLQTLWEKRKEVARLDNPEGWLFKCAYHKSLNKLRAERRRDNVAVPTDLDIPIKEDTQTDMELREIARRIDEAIERLPAQQKRIIQLGREGMNRKEIARHFRLSESTVKNHITEAYRALRTALADLIDRYFN